MKRYRVFYTIKMDSTLYEYYLDVEAGNKKEAIKQVREKVYSETGRNAFTPKATSKNVITTNAIEGLPPKK